MKPLTSFASGNHLKSQKPTAKVRPQMKCMTSPSQEAPPNILQRSNSRGSSNVSRMNDLDDISLTDPMPVNRNTSSTGKTLTILVIYLTACSDMTSYVLNSWYRSDCSIAIRRDKNFKGKSQRILISFISTRFSVYHCIYALYRK